MKHYVIATLAATTLVGGLVSPAKAEGPPTVLGVIMDRKLRGGAPIAKVQAAMAIKTFMNEGTKDCTSATGCSSSVKLINSDGSVNYGYVQNKANGVMGTQSVELNSDAESSSIATQVGKLPLLCFAGSGRTDPAFKTPVVVAGVAIKPASCSVDAAGNAQFTFQVCTAPAFGKPIRNAPNAVACSSNPADPSYIAPTGSVCASQACDSEPAGSQYGWSSVQSITYSAANVSAQENGRALIFYPTLGGGISADYTADSETMTVIKIVDTYHSAEKNEAAIGMKVALRFKRQVTKEALKGEGPPILHPEEKTSQWRTLATLNQSETLATETGVLGGKGAECAKNVIAGLEDRGNISVCDQSYNENGVKPMAVSAQVVTSAAQCSTTTQCISEIVQTTTWSETCTSAVTIATKECKTTTAWALYQQEDIALRMTAECSESRSISKPSCTITAQTPNCTMVAYNPPLPTGACVPDSTAGAPEGACTWVSYNPPPPTSYQACDAPRITNGCSAYE